MPRSKPVSVVRPQLSTLIADLAKGGDPIEITQNGETRAVLISSEDYDSLIETLEILNDRQAVDAIGAGLRDLREGRRLSHADVFGEGA